MRAVFASLFLLFCSSSALDVASLVAFADANWDCTTAACTARVTQGTFQDSYQCSEFVSRSVAAGGGIPGLAPTDPQSSFGNYQFNGKTYDLLWVSSVQGLPLGLEDFLQVAGWTNIGSDCTKITAGNVIITDGSNGPHSHNLIGVGNQLADAHNSAALHTNPCYYTVNAVYAAPPVSGTNSNTPSPATSPATAASPATSAPPTVSCVAVYNTTTSVNLRDAASLNGRILMAMPAGSIIYDVAGTTVAANGYNWREVRFGNTVGFAADSYLVRVGPCPTSAVITPTAAVALGCSIGYNAIVLFAAIAAVLVL